MGQNALREIYLDNNATTPVLPIAAEAARDAMQSLYGNPSSTHITGLKARFILDNTRALAKKVIGAGEGRVIFLSGATEGIQTAIFSALYQLKQTIKSLGTNPYKYLLYGATEHKAVPNSLAHWSKVLELGATPLAIPVDGQGKLDDSFIQNHLAESGMICTMAVNNETGVITDLPVIGKLIESHNPDILWMVDCVQALGKQALALESTRIDYAPFSGHKLYGPKGIGMLYVREGAPLTPFIAGGGQEQGLRSGTENLPGVAAFGAILNELDTNESHLFRDHQTLEGYRQRLVSALNEAFPGIVYNMPFETSVPTTINFSINDFPSKEILDLFDAAQIRVSSGSACSSGVTRSYVLDAMGIPAWQSESAIRMSFGPAVTEVEINEACDRIKQASSALTQSCLMLNHFDGDIRSPKQSGLIQWKKDSACTWIYADSDAKTCVIIDPLEELGERLEKFVQCQEYKVLAIVDTHSHADHESCRPMLQTILKDYLAYSLDDYDNLGWPIQNALSVSLDNGQQVSAFSISDHLVFASLPTPGHTGDSRSYLLGQAQNGYLKKASVQFAFVGDTILMGGLGRTNFSTSSAAQLHQSLLSLHQTISKKSVLCSAHDYNNQFSTTLETEIKNNSLLRDLINQSIDVAQFVQRKEQLDKQLNDQIGHEILCGVVECAENLDGVNIQPQELHQYLVDHPGTRLIDVREAHEFHLFDNWESLRLAQKPENIPLSKLTAFIQTTLSDDNNQSQELLFICRSGARSGKVAETFRRLGFKNTRHVLGGVALTCC